MAFADLVLLNKTDLVDDAALARIESRIRGINGTAKIHRTKNADVPIDKVLNVGAFDLQRALAVDEAFLEPEYPVRVGRRVPARGRRLSTAHGAANTIIIMNMDMTGTTTITTMTTTTKVTRTRISSWCCCRWPPPPPRR